MNEHYFISCLFLNIILLHLCFLFILLINSFSSCLPHSDEHSNSSLLESTFSNLLHTLFWTQYESKLLNHRGFSIWTLMVRQQIFSIFAMDFGKTRCILILKFSYCWAYQLLEMILFLCLILGTFEYCKYVELVFSFGAFLLDSPWFIFFFINNNVNCWLFMYGFYTDYFYGILFGR